MSSPEFYALEVSSDTDNPEVWLSICRESFLEYFKKNKQFVPVVLFLNKKKGIKFATQILLRPRNNDPVPLFQKERVLRGLFGNAQFNPIALFVLSSEEIRREGETPIQLMVLHEGTPQNVQIKAFRVDDNGENLKFLPFELSSQERLEMFPKNLLRSI